MDGNARWAYKKNISKKEGYINGLDKINEVIDLCFENRIKYLTLFALSSENIKRPTVNIIYKIIKNNKEKLIKDLTAESKVKVKFIGNKTDIPDNIKKILKELEVFTENNKLLNLNVAFNYGSINEIIYSINKIIKSNNKTDFTVNEKIIRDNLYLPNTPDPDILIRTGGFKRLSNFLLFQLSYTELFFIDTLWPDITRKEIIDIFNKYKSTERKYGLQ